MADDPPAWLAESSDSSLEGWAELGAEDAVTELERRHPGASGPLVIIFENREDRP